MYACIVSSNSFRKWNIVSWVTDRKSVSRNDLIVVQMHLHASHFLCRRYQGKTREWIWTWIEWGTWHTNSLSRQGNINGERMSLKGNQFLLLLCASEGAWGTKRQHTCIQFPVLLDFHAQFPLRLRPRSYERVCCREIERLQGSMWWLWSELDDNSTPTHDWLNGKRSENRHHHHNDFGSGSEKENRKTNVNF